MSGSSSPSVVIVDRHRLFADCLCIALAEGGHRCRVRVPHPRSTVTQVVGAIRREHPRVVVLSANSSPAWDSLELIAPLGKIGAEVVVVTEDADATRTCEALRRGARTVLPKRSSLDTFRVVIRQVVTGDTPSPGRFGRSATAPTTPAPAPAQTEEDGLRARLQQLSSRENEILGLMMEGNNVSEIARLNVVSEATVRTQVRSILSKLGVSSQLAAVSVARRAGWPRQPHLRRTV